LGRYDFFVMSQLALIPLLPFVVHLALGDVEKSGGVILWSFFFPLGAAVFRDTSKGWRWFRIYVCISIVLLTKAFWDVKEDIVADIIVDKAGDFFSLTARYPKGYLKGIRSFPW